jgi:parvulin-like peptidyl-prolyl isomerase
VFLLLIGAAGCQKPAKDQPAGGSGQGSGQTVARAGSGSGAGSAAAGQGSGSAAPVEAKDIDSKDILARTETAPEVQVKHVLLAWNGMQAQRGLDPRAAKRSNAETATLALDIAAKLKANPDAIDDLVKQYSEDPGSASSGEPYTVKESTGFVEEFKKLALRLKEKEVGIVKTAFGYHVIERVPPPPPDPLESADIMARPPETGVMHLQQIVISWKDTRAAKSPQADPRAKDRTKADADKLVQEVLDKARAPKTDMTALAKQYSEEPGAKDTGGRVIQLTAEMPVDQQFENLKKLAVRLKVGEVGAVKSPFGWHIMKRVPPPPPDTLESAAILKREPQAKSVEVKHILLGWTAVHPPNDPKGEKRDRATLEKLVKDTVAKLAKGAKIEPLMTELSEDPGSASDGKAYPVSADAQMVQPFKDLSLRLKVGEVGVVKSDFGIHIIQRVK